MILLLPFLHLLLLQSPVTAEDQIFYDCSGISNYTSGSPFESNLKTLLSALSTNGPLNHDSFYNTSEGEDSNKVYGFSQCMSGTSADECGECLANSKVEIVKLCPNRREATVQYYDCILRYSDRRFFSEPDTSPLFFAWDPEIASNTSQFNMKLGDMMDNLSITASSLPSKYATMVSSYMDFDKIYGSAECTRDLSEEDCYTCLREMIRDIPKCCDGKRGGKVNSLSCGIRFEAHPFFGGSPPPPPPLSPVAAAPTLSIAVPSKHSGTKDKWRRFIIIIISIIIMSFIISIVSSWMFIRRKVTRRESEIKSEEQKITGVESLLFGLDTLKIATNDFCNANKIGEGGFGPVYKGKLLDGRQIAVKRLSNKSEQGLDELRNEVALVAKLQHRNLVRLWGCCMEEQDKMLVYEYVPNTSLDRFIFDPIKRLQLSWEKRYKIIVGIARGLLYLHEDSIVRIIHRDLKTSNILLDGNMNPKIADFGVARLFNMEQTHANTSRIAGTYGYMAPEYASQGTFSTKSDVFSFGVLVLEIVTGRKNTNFVEDEHMTNLLRYVWRHWNERTCLKIVDQAIEGDDLRNEMLKCIHLGLSCVQEDATKRPTISMVLLMLSTSSVTLPIPSHPPGT